MGQTDLLNLLFENGALGMLEWLDRSDQTALHYAAEIGNVAVSCIKEQESGHSNKCYWEISRQ